MEIAYDHIIRMRDIRKRIKAYLCEPDDELTEEIYILIDELQTLNSGLIYMVRDAAPKTSYQFVLMSYTILKTYKLLRPGELYVTDIADNMRRHLDVLYGGIMHNKEYLELLKKSYTLYLTYGTKITYIEKKKIKTQMQLMYQDHGIMIDTQIVIDMFFKLQTRINDAKNFDNKTICGLEAWRVLKYIKKNIKRCIDDGTRIELRNIYDELCGFTQKYNKSVLDKFTNIEKHSVTTKKMSLGEELGPIDATVFDESRTAGIIGKNAENEGLDMFTMMAGFGNITQKRRDRHGL